MFSYAASLGLLAASILSLSSAQLLVKWRFSVLEFASAGAAARSKWDSVLLMLQDVWLWGAGFLIVASALCWYLTLTRLPLSFMLPVAAITSPIVAVSAHLLLAEPLSGRQLAAILTIAAGVAWLGWEQ